VELAIVATLLHACLSLTGTSAIPCAGRGAAGGCRGFGGFQRDGFTVGVVW
jgi:hypothetical protein